MTGERQPGSDKARMADKGNRITREDISDIAKIGGDILKRTVGIGVEVFKEVADGLPKEATQFIANRKDEVLKGISKEVAQNLMNVAIDRFFSVIRKHKVEVSVRIVAVDEAELPKERTAPRSASAPEPDLEEDGAEEPPQPTARAQAREAREAQEPRRETRKSHEERRPATGERGSSETALAHRSRHHSPRRG